MSRLGSVFAFLVVVTGSSQDVRKTVTMTSNPIDRILQAKRKISNELTLEVVATPPPPTIPPKPSPAPTPPPEMWYDFPVRITPS